MEHIQQQNAEALEELYARYVSQMRIFLFRMLGGNRERADDFLQDLFLKLWEKPHVFDTSRRFSPWFYMMATNLCKNEYKRNYRYSPLLSENEELLPGKSDAGELAIDLQSFRAELYHELDALSHEHRTVFLLRYSNDISIKEISEIMDCPEGTVKSRIHYTLRQLSEKLAKYKDRVELPHE
jgi:RNA polymerase sigma-70 factor (ECF subfamily)